MKKKIMVFALAFALLFYAQPFYAAGLQNETYSVGEPANGATVVFDANGGTGSMANQTVAPGVVTRLVPNAFTRPDSAFCGWNTKADGKGTAYADQADVSSLAAEYNGGKITLYAQWKINAPKIKSMKSLKPGSLKVAFQKNTQAGSYEIQYALNKKFSKAQTASVKKGAASCELTDLMPGKTYYVRMRSYDNAAKSYGDWGDSKKKKVKKGFTIMNVKSDATIEADVMLTGSGTGCHAKLVMATAGSAVSYGIQYDKCAVAPYTGKAMALIENVASNAAGGQKYSRPGNKSLKLGKTYHMMMTINKKGSGAVYLDYKKIGSFSNPTLAKQAKQGMALRIEASARLNGDTVKAVFKNIKLKSGKKYDPNRSWGMTEHTTNKTLKGKCSNGSHTGVFTLYGKISGLPAGGDWDNCYDRVSEVVDFN